MYLLLIIAFQLVNCKAYSQTRVKMGAYYFDGWRNIRSVHLTSSLVNNFSSRQPKWGWVTSTQKIVDEQIKVASKNGLSFFSFCWFYKKGGDSPLNNALNLYLKSPNRSLLEFSLLVSNHEGYEIGPSNWRDFQTRAINLFKLPGYVKANNKPLIVFFSLQTLIKQFGSAEKVAIAFESLREQARREGLAGVSIAGCVSNDPKNILLAERCGVDILTGYNYHDVGLFRQSGSVPIEKMASTERQMWNSFKSLTNLQYIPVSTLNWDPRPWANKSNRYSTSPYYKGYSKQSVYNSVKGCADWLQKNTSNTTPEKIGLLYAWNEYGEGAYLTPTKNGENLAEGIIKALNN